MDICDGLYNFLIAQATLYAVVGTRIYPGVAPQGAIRSGSYLTYGILNSEHAFSLNKGPCAFSNTPIMFTIHANSYANRVQAREALRNVLHGRGNTILSQTDGSTINMKCARLVTINDGYEDAGDGNQIGVFGQDMFFDITFLEAVPTLP